MKLCKTQARKWYATLAAFMLACALACAGMAFTQADEAWADATVTDWNGLQAAVADGGTITLANDIVAEGTITISNEVTITGGKTIYSKAGRTSYDSMFKVANGGKLTIGEGVTLSGKTSTDGTSGICPEPTTYTADKFTGDVSADGKTYDPKGFFIQVERGGTATLNGTISDFVTSRNKADTPRYVAPVVANGSNAMFNIGSKGVIKNNLVGYIVDDAKANNDAQTIKQYVKGAPPNVPRVPNVSAQKANSGNYSGRPRSTNAGIDDGVPGSGITATAGAVIYKDGAKGIVEGTIQNNRADTGGIMASGPNTQVNIKEGTTIAQNVGVQFGGGSTAEQGGRILMTGGTMSKNVAWFGGGAVYATENGVDWLLGRMSGDDGLHPQFDSRKDGEFFMEGGTLTENTAFTRGGAVLADSDGVNIQGGKLSYNMGRMLGGAMYVMGDHPKYEYTVQMTGLYVHDNASVSGEKKARDAATAPNSDILAQKWGNGWDALNAPMQTLLQDPTTCGDTGDILSGQVTGGKGKGNTDDWTDGTGAQGTGGGVWLCAYGNTIFDANEPDEVIITDNWATGAPGAPFNATGAYHKTLWDPDLADAKNNSQTSTASRSGVAGGSDFHADTGNKGTVVINGLTDANWTNENTKEKYESTVSSGRLNLVNNNPAAMRDEALKVEVYGNLSRHGGGLAADGTFIFGTAGDQATPSATLSVEKEWANSVEKAPVTIQVSAETAKGKAILANVPLDGVANPPETEFDTIEELAPAGNTWNGRFVFPMSAEAEHGTAKLYTLVYTGENIDTGAGFTLTAGMEMDPLSFRGKTALGAALKNNKQDKIKVLFGEPEYEDSTSDPKIIKKNADGSYKVEPISIQFNEFKDDGSGTLVECTDYVFTPGELNLEDINYSISATPHYKTTYDPATGEIVVTDEVLYSIYLFEIPLTGPMTNDNWPITEKYVNKDVHSDIVNFDQEFTYDILAYVPMSATELTITDTLVKGLEFADKDGNPTTDPLKAVQSITMKMANNHLPGEEGTVTSGAVLHTYNGNPIDFIAWGPKYGDKYYPTMNIEGSTLSITFDHSKPTDDRVFGINNANEKWLPGRWIQVTFNARIKDEYRNLDALKELQAEVEGKTTSWEGTGTNKWAPDAHDVTFANGDLGLVAALVSEVGPDPIDWAVEAPSRLFAHSSRGEYYATPFNDKSGNTWVLLEKGSDDWNNADNRYNGRPPEANNTKRQIDLDDSLLDELDNQPLVIGHTLIKGAEGGSRLFVQTEDAKGNTHIFTTPNNDKSGATWYEITAADGQVYKNAIARLKPDNGTIRMLDLTTGSFTLDGNGKNWPVISEEEHEGMANQAGYNVKFGNGAEGTYKTNTVTVAPETTEIKAVKKWDGNDGAWPDDVANVTFNVYSVKADDAGDPVETAVYVDSNGKVVGSYADGDSNIPAGATKLTVTLTEASPEATVSGLPRLKGVRYIAHETKVGDNDVIYNESKTTGRSPENSPTVFTAMKSALLDDRFTKLAETTGEADMPIFGAEADNRLFAMTESGKFYVTFEGDTTGVEDDTEWTLVPVPGSSASDEEIALYNRAVEIFNKTADPAVTVTPLTESFTATNTKPQVEKYVNNKVHVDLEGFDTEFTYSVMGYVPANATKVVLTDTLTKDLEFVNPTVDKVLSAVHLYKTNDHVGSGSGTVSTTSGSNFIRNAAAVASNTRPVQPGKTEKDYKIEVTGGNTVTLTLDEGFLEEIRTTEGKVKDAEDKSFWVKMSFKAKIKEASYDEIVKKIKSGSDASEDPSDPNALKWEKVTSDGPVKNGADVQGDKSHAGLLNKASYKVFIGDEGSSDYFTNTVTVKPKTTELEVLKKWVDKVDPSDIDTWTISYKWPEGMGEPESITVKLLLGGEYVSNLSWWSETGLPATLDMTPPSPNDGTVPSKVTFENLPVIEGKSYTIEEVFPDGTKYYMPLLSSKDGTTTITNQEEEPQVEKYVNKDVHAELEAFNEIFTYDIMAYVPSNATEFEITDTLEKTLQFETAAGDVEIMVLGAANDHKTTVNTAGTAIESVDSALAVTKTIEPADASSLGEDDTQKLTVSVSGIADGSGVRGKWVKVCFTARIRDAYRTMDSLTASGTWAKEDDDKTTQKQFKDPNNPNSLVDSDEKHEGIKNKADYKVGNDSGFRYDYDTNTVTVKPGTEDLEITKVWSDGTTADRMPEGMTEDTFKSWMKLIKIVGTDALDITASHEPVVTANTNGTYTVSWTGLPKEYIDPENPDEGFVCYAAQEDPAKATGYTTTYSGKADTEGATFEGGAAVGEAAADGGTITNAKSALEKYINKNVHKFVGLDEVFTYDIIAFVTADADELEITDELDSQLQFAKSGADVKVYDMGTSNNHMTADKGAEESTEATVTKRGTPITNKASISTANGKLVVKIANSIRSIDNTTGVIDYASEDLSPYRGHFIRVEFKAQLADSVVELVNTSGKSIGELIAEDELDVVPINDNSPLSVTDTQKDHTGIKNEAEYTIKVGNDGKYSDKSNIVTVVPEKPEIEKYVEKDVHSDIKLDTVFTYDIIAYVTSDADKITITDELVDDLEFVSTKDTVSVVDLGTSDNHKTNGSYTAENPDASVSGAGTAIVPADAVQVLLTSRDLTVIIANDLNDANKQYLTPYRGHWIKVTFQAQIKKALQDQIKAGTKTLADLENVTIKANATESRDVPNVGNAPVQSDKDHTGICNKSSYDIEVGNAGKYHDESNTVTVKPDSIDLKVNKTWMVGTAAVDWPAGATVEAIVVDNNGTEVAKETLTADKPSHTFAKLPVLEGVSYSITEGKVTGADAFTMGAPEVSDDGLTYTFVNKAEGPEIEKYVAQAVHKEIDLEEEFTYDILAYVTGDADTVTITDVLDEQLQFVSVASDVKVVSHNDDNHKPRNDVAGNAIVKNADATVCATGDPVNGATITIDNNTLTVFIEDATALRSKWVQVTFTAKIADGLTLSDLKYTAIDPEEKEERAEPNKGNDPVKSTEAHAGVPNKTSYVIGVKNAAGKIEYKHKDESNTVTVKPKAQPTDVVLWVTKSMEDETGTSIAPEADAFTFQLKLTDPNGAVTMQRVSNSEEEGTRACFSVAGLDVPGEYKYEVTEVVGSDATIAYDTRLLEGSFCVAEFILPTKKTQPLTILGGLPVVLRSGLASQFAFAITPAKAEDTANGATFERIMAVVDKATYDSYGGKAQKIDSRDDLNGVTLDAVEAGTFVNKKGGQQMLSAEASTVTKKWADGGNAKDRKPVNFELWRKVGESGEWECVEGKTLTLTEEHSANTSEWTGRFDNLPAYENDELISYRVIEANSGDFSGLYTPGDDEEIVVVDMSSETGMSGTNHPNTPNTAIEIMVSKKAVGATAELKGAKLQVLDADGKVAVDGNGERLEWTTTDKPHAIPMMPVGLYKLHEVSAPSGYDLAADIQFRVNVDGSVEVFDGKDWKAYDDKGIVMYDKPSTGKKPSTSKSTAKTGDTSGAATLSFALLAVLSAAALGATGRRAFGKK